MVSGCDFYHLHSWRIFSLAIESWGDRFYHFCFQHFKMCLQSFWSLLPYMCSPVSEHFVFFWIFGFQQFDYSVPKNSLITLFGFHWKDCFCPSPNLGNGPSFCLYNILINVDKKCFKEFSSTTFIYLLQLKQIWCLTMRTNLSQKYLKNLFESISQW